MSTGRRRSSVGASDTSIDGASDSHCYEMERREPSETEYPLPSGGVVRPLSTAAPKPGAKAVVIPSATDGFPPAEGPTRAADEHEPSHFDDIRSTLKRLERQLREERTARSALESTVKRQANQINALQVELGIVKAKKPQLKLEDDGTDKLRSRELRSMELESLRSEVHDMVTRAIGAIKPLLPPPPSPAAHDAKGTANICKGPHESTKKMKRQMKAEVIETVLESIQAKTVEMITGKVMAAVRGQVEVERAKVTELVCDWTETMNKRWMDEEKQRGVLVKVNMSALERKVEDARREITHTTVQARETLKTSMTRLTSTETGLRAAMTEAESMRKAYCDIREDVQKGLPVIERYIEEDRANAKRRFAEFTQVLDLRVQMASSQVEESKSELQSATAVLEKDIHDLRSALESARTELDTEVQSLAENASQAQAKLAGIEAQLTTMSSDTERKLDAAVKESTIALLRERTAAIDAIALHARNVTAAPASTPAPAATSDAPARLAQMEKYIQQIHLAILDQRVALDKLARPSPGPRTPDDIRPSGPPPSSSTSDSGSSSSAFDSPPSSSPFAPSDFDMQIHSPRLQGTTILHVTAPSINHHQPAFILPAASGSVLGVLNARYIANHSNEDAMLVSPPSPASTTLSEMELSLSAMRADQAAEAARAAPPSGVGRIERSDAAPVACFRVRDTH